MADTAQFPPTLVKLLTDMRADPKLSMNRLEISDRYLIAVGAVDAMLLPAVTQALLTCANDADRGRYWRAGPMLRNWQAPATGGSATASGSSRKREGSGTRARQHLPALDLSALVVSADKPLPAGRHGYAKGMGRHDAIFDRLTADGMSVTGIPVEYDGAIRKAAQSYLKARPQLSKLSMLVVRHLGDSLGVWRTPRPGAEADAGAQAGPAAVSTIRSRRAA